MQYQFTVRLEHFKTKAKDRTSIFAHTGLVDSTSIGLNWQKSCEERSQPSPHQWAQRLSFRKLIGPAMSFDWARNRNKNIDVPNSHWLYVLPFGGIHYGNLALHPMNWAVIKKALITTIRNHHQCIGIEQKTFDTFQLCLCGIEPALLQPLRTDRDMVKKSPGRVVYQTTKSLNLRPCPLPCSLP